MIKGLYMAASGMNAVERRQEIIANNIANAATPGFKRHEPVQLGFRDVFFDAQRHPFRFNVEAAPAGGVKVVESFSDTRPGLVRFTENPLHLALEGPGFFAVDTPEGERFTRAGDFSIDAEGHLSTTGGFKVLAEDGGFLDVRGGMIVVNGDGGVSVDGVPAGALRVIEFAAPERLLRQGDNLFSATEDVLAASGAAGETQVRQKQLEMSNVNLPQEMLKMMLGLRAYEANQRVIHGIDEATGRMIERVGMPS